MQTASGYMGNLAKRPHAGRWIVATLIGFAVLGGLNAWRSWRSFAVPLSGFMPRQMALAQYPSQDVVGHVGGMPVRIPRDIARFVEYDGDPRFGERRLGPPPRRTSQSAIKSFGFQVRFPDWATLSDKEAEEDYRLTRIGTSRWITVGVISGGIYPKDGFLDRAVHNRILRRNSHPLDQFAPIPSEYLGLSAYAIPGIDPTTGAPYRSSGFAEDLFVAWTSEGKVTTYISCKTAQRNPSCHHSWSLEQLGIKAEMTATYPRRMLENWKEIQEGSTEKLFEFRFPSA